MEINHLIFFDDLLVILCASLLTTVVFQRLRLPTIVAYLAAGALVGPFGLAWVEEPENFRFVAEFGVVFLLFSLGLEFSLPRLLALRKSVFGLGSVQVLVCTLCFGGAVFLWGSTLEASVLVAGALALSSTAIVTRELAALKRVHTRQGQLAIGVLLFQDLVAVVFLILVPVLASDQADPGQGAWPDRAAAQCGQVAAAAPLPGSGQGTVGGGVPAEYAGDRAVGGLADPRL